MKTREDHPAFQLRLKFLNGEIQAKEVFALKTISRIINHVYTARSIELKEDIYAESTISLLEWTYDMLWHRYGL